MFFSVLVVLLWCSEGVPHVRRELSGGQFVKQAIGDQTGLFQWITSVPLGLCETTKRNLQSFGVINLRSNIIGNLCYIQFESNDDLEEMVQHVLNIDVEPNLVVGKSSIAWHLDRIDQSSLPLDNGALTSAFDGTGVNVYIMDTGVKITHEQFGSRAQHGDNFSLDTTLDDLDGHGTHCASTCCGRDYGVASGSNIINVKVLDANGEGTFFGILQGYSWISSNRGSTPSVVSMSLSGSYSSSLNNAATTMAGETGVIVVVAAGNDNQDANLNSPASAGAPVVTVGATDIFDHRASFSNYGDKVFTWAPGVSITGAGISSNTAVAVSSGTSMSTPIVAGVAASLLEKYNGDKTLALQHLYDIGAKNIITDVKNSLDNYLAQTDRGTPSPTAPTPPTAPTTSSPTPAPVSTPVPTSVPTKSPTVVNPSPLNILEYIQANYMDVFTRPEVLVGVGAGALVLLVGIIWCCCK